ncbi:MAG: hypothetical protein AB7O67_04220 [Vicinamibacterales bacterium]
MRILVCARHFGYLRNFESGLAELAARGHALHLAADRGENAGGLQMVERLAARFPNVTVGWTPPRAKDDPWLDLATGIRLSQDYLRYLDRRYDRSPMLRRRSKERTPRLAVWLVEKAGFRFRPGRAALGAALGVLEDGVPLHAPYTAFLEEQRPDVVVLTPLIDLGSPQLDLFKSARALGLRTVLAVGSWDHLSSKSRLRWLPDRVTVWNPIQRDEARQMHGVPDERIAVTGAQCYDQWFDRVPTRSREAFLAAMGLPPDRPFVLYVCSSLFRGDPPEADFVVDWLRALRASPDPRLAGVGVLVRPHPGRADEWAKHDVSSLGVAFHGANPIDEEARRDYFEALHYASAVVGLNTSAFIEAGIAGRPVLAVLPKPYWKSQEGTLHFHYLTDAGGGLLRTSRSLDEHLAQLAAAVSGEAPADNRGFVTAFVRPYGLDAPATPRFADAIEAAGRVSAPPPAGGGLGGRLIGRPLLDARLAARHAAARWRRTRKDAKHDVRKARERALRAVRQPMKRWANRLSEGWTPRVAAPAGAAPSAAASAEVFDVVETARRSRRPIVAGPWLSETGFELLYWIPFLRWAQRYGHLRSERIVVVSRGGSRGWYGDLAGRYVDVFDLASVEEFRQAQEQRIGAQDGQKQYEPTAFEQDLVRRVARRLGLGRFDWLHPALMYNVFKPFWMQAASGDLLRAFTIHRRVDAARVPRLEGLPDRYVAVKFYTNLALPADEANQRLVRRLVARLAVRHHVVLLQTGLDLDDHGEFAPGSAARIHTLDHLMTPATNLDVQTRAVAHADLLVATYGGFSYLGPLLGVDTLTFYSDARGFRLDHLDVARRAFREVGGAAFQAFTAAEFDLLESLLPAGAPVHG